MVMEAMIEKKASLGTLAKEVVIYPQLLQNVRVADKKTAREHAAVTKVIARIEKELGEEGRIIVRESGTEPVLRVMVEGPSREICKTYVDLVVNTMKEHNLLLE